MNCNKELTDLSSIRLYKQGTLQYIDLLVEDFKLFESSLDSPNVYATTTEYYAGIGAGYVTDSEELEELNFELTGTIVPSKFRQVVTFMSIPKQRYKLEIVKDGVTYIKYCKRGPIKSSYRDRKPFNEVTRGFIAETPWLEVSKEIKIDSKPLNNAGKYGSSKYGEGEYAVETSAPGATRTIIPDSEGRVFWQMEAESTGTEIQIVVNGETISTTSPVAAGLKFRYTNIPFYCSCTLNEESLVPILNKQGKLFETAFIPFEQNTISVLGLKDIKLVYYNALGVI